MTPEIRSRISRIGPAHPNWKGGWLDNWGYIHLGDRGKRSHISWNEAHPDDPVRPGEIIHHINEIKTDDRPENLAKLRSQREHASHHGKREYPERRKTIQRPCEHCGQSLSKRQQYERRRFCSHACATALQRAITRSEWINPHRKSKAS